MTIVELFDRVPVHNIMSILSLSPEKIIFLGERKNVEKNFGVYEDFARKIGSETKLESQPVNKNDLDEIVNTLCEIVDREEECTFDLTGGEDLVLVAAGIVYSKYQQTERVQLHRINVGSGVLQDCDDETVPDCLVQPQMSVEDCVALYGGAVVGYTGKKGTYSWNFEGGFAADVLCMWEMCREDPRLWNNTLSIISALVKYYTEPDNPARVDGSKYYIQKITDTDEESFDKALVLLRRLQKCGFLTDYHEDDDALRFGFRDEQIRKCLTKEGTILELIVYYLALQTTNPDGSLKFNDVRTGVFIDWDGEVDDDDDDNYDTENEIDVILMKGMVPVFISCKNGLVDSGELYKLNAVANRFGGPYAKKVIIVSKTGKTDVRAERHFIQRAKDMNIRCIENVADLSFAEFTKLIKNIGC